jgi:hypothetical protein
VGQGYAGLLPELIKSLLPQNGAILLR